MSDNSEADRIAPSLAWSPAARIPSVTARLAKPDARSGYDSTMRIAIVDCTPFTRECIAASIRDSSRRLPRSEDIEVEGFASCEEVMRPDNRFDVIVYHYHRLQGEIGPDLSKITELAPVIVLSADDDADVVRAAFDCGVRGFIPTASSGLELLIEVLRFVNVGGSFIPPSILGPSGTPPTDSRRLTQRELLVMDLLKKGKQNKVIAYELGMSESTVKVHIRNILAKLRAKNRTEAVSTTMQMETNNVIKL